MAHTEMTRSAFLRKLEINVWSCAMEVNKIYQGNARDILKTFPEESIDMTMTSPPYWALRDYGVKEQIGLEKTFEQYINNLCDIFDEVKRVTKKTGTCWVNIGDTYMGNSSYSNKGRAGFEMKDENINEWVRSLGTGKCLICGKEIPKNKTFCSRKCLNKKGNDFRSQFRQIPNKCLIGIPFRFALEMINRGWILRNTIIWHKRNCMPSSAKDRFTVDFEYLFFFSKKKKYYFEQQFEPYQTTIQEMGANRNGEYFGEDTKEYSTAKAQSPSETKKRILKNLKPQGRNKRTTWTINPKPFKEAHFAVYPEELCETPIKAGCPKQGIVLDPFFGAGTTGLVALKQNKNFIGIELNKKYIEIAEKRLAPHKKQKRLDI